MIGRALCRLPLRSRLPRANNLPAQYDCAAQIPQLVVARTYATPGRPKSVVGEPSRPVKRAVKKAAAKPATGDSPAEKQVRAKQHNASTKKSKAKKTLTPEEKAANKEKADAKKARAKVTAEKTKLADLKKAALKPPKVHRGANAYTIFVIEKMKDKRPDEITTEKMKDIAQQWKNTTPAEQEHCNHLANESKAQSEAEYKRWVESHSPEEIHRANLARRQLRAKQHNGDSKTRVAKWPHIKDERAVKRPVSAYVQFAVNRNASGDFKNIDAPERLKLIGQEWKALAQDEKTKYTNIYRRDLERYVSEHKDVYGYAPPTATSATAAAAA